MTNTSTKTNLQETEIKRIFELQKANQYHLGNTTVADRKAKLEKLHKAVLQYRPALKTALFEDFRKHPSEVDLTEVYPITSEIKHAKRHLRKWMGKHKVATPFGLLGSSSYIKYEPKGVVLIISPWNFPFNLTFGPLVAAIAAGNAVIIKPSENTPHTTALMKKMIEGIFPENEVALFDGGVSTSTALLKLPFNHIFFTGAPSIGKIVMEAAAKHLTSVTLELGGKSPTIVDETADVVMAARRIAWGKFVNNGQVCLAPDYLLVHENKKQTFIDAFNETIQGFYSDQPAEAPSYARIVNKRHFLRLKSYITEAVDKGARVEAGGTVDEANKYIAPTVMTNVPEDTAMMKEEIFGPVIPIRTFKNISEVIEEVNSREKPLALYIYSKNKKNIKQILSNTRAGGSCINHNVVHFFNNDLPFGGSNNSGIGKAHGKFGFEAFSNARGILKQHIPNALELLLPPYNDMKQRLIDFTIKYF